MKKIIIIFLTILIIGTCLALPAFAVVPSNLNNYNNVFTERVDSNFNFYTSEYNSSLEPMYYVYLKPNTDYTFIATNGVRRFFAGSVNGSDVNSYNSINLLSFPSGYSFNMNGIEFDISDDGTITLNGTCTSDIWYDIGTAYLDKGEFYLFGVPFDFSGSWNTSLLYCSSDPSWISYSSSPQGYNSFSEGYFTFSIFIKSGYNCNNLVYKPMVVEGNDYPVYSQGWDYFYNDNYSSVLTFSTSRFSSDVNDNGLIKVAIGLNDYVKGSSDTLFSRLNVSDGTDNEFYLIEGKINVKDIDVAFRQDSFNSGYDSGFDQGYKEGEYDGLNATKFMNSTLLTSISAPFVIVSSALNFDIFGINFYHILQVIFTLLLVAFVVTKLKGRE